MDKVELKKDEETLIYSKTSGANLVVTQRDDGFTVRVSFGDLIVDIESASGGGMVVSSNGTVT